VKPGIAILPFSNDGGVWCIQTIIHKAAPPVLEKIYLMNLMTLPIRAGGKR
jgi:hypothetical protein